MTLETIVPSLEDCKGIPQGAFAESALVWLIAEPEKLNMDENRTDDGTYVGVEVRENCWEDNTIYPAPTLAEILAELPYGTTVMLDAPNTWVCINRDKKINITKADNPATAALKLWKRINNKDGE